MKEYNAIISNTMLGIIDNGCFTYWIEVEYSGKSYQTFGYYLLVGSRSIDYIRKIIETVGVKSWEELKGKYIRVKTDGLGFGKITEISHIVNDNWFNISNFN